MARGFVVYECSLPAQHFACPMNTSEGTAIYNLAFDKICLQGSSQAIAEEHTRARRSSTHAPYEWSSNATTIRCRIGDATGRDNDFSVEVPTKVTLQKVGSGGLA